MVMRGGFYLSTPCQRLLRKGNRSVAQFTLSEFGLGCQRFNCRRHLKVNGRKPKVVESAEWAVDVKAESLGVDTRKLYLEATGQWPPIPKRWDEASTAEVVTRLATVKSYLVEHVVPFFTNF